MRGTITVLLASAIGLFSFFGLGETATATTIRVTMMCEWKYPIDFEEPSTCRLAGDPDLYAFCRAWEGRWFLIQAPRTGTYFEICKPKSSRIGVK